MSSSTFVLLKPSALHRNCVFDILSRFEKKGFAVDRLELVAPPREQMERHYAEHAGKSFYDALVDRMTNKCMYKAIVLGPLDVVDQVRAMVGDTKTPGTIRGDFAYSVENVIHASDSDEAARREIQLWFDQEPRVILHYTPLSRQ